MSVEVKVKRAATSVLVTALAGAALIMSPASPAAAGNMNGSCESGEFCMYYLTGYRGALADMEYNESNFQGKTFANSSTSRNDNGMSGKDRGFSAVGCLYTAANYSGNIVNQGVNKEWTSFGSYNNQASSLRWSWTALWCAM